MASDIPPISVVITANTGAFTRSINSVISALARLGEQADKTAAQVDAAMASMYASISVGAGKAYAETAAAAKISSDEQVAAFREATAEMTANNATSTAEQVAVVEAGAEKKIAANEEVTASAMRTGRSISGLGMSLAASLTLPLALVGVAAIKSAESYSQAMATVAAHTNYTEAQVKQFGTQTVQVASNVGVSANEAAQALYIIGSNGVKASQAMGVLNTVLKGSVSGLGDAQTVARLTSAMMNAYSKSNLTAKSALDVLTQSVKEGNLKTTELAGSFGRVLPIASETGVRIGDVGAAFAILSKDGMSASNAASSLQGMMKQLIAPSKGTQQAFAAVHMSAQQFREEIANKGLLPALQDLQDKFGGNIDKMGAVFKNVRGLNGVLTILSQNQTDVANAFDRVNNSAGAADAAYNKVAKSGAFQLSKAFNDLKNALIPIGNVLMPIIANIAKFVADLADKFSHLNPAVQQFIVYIGLAAAALGPLIMIIGGLVTAVTTIGAAFSPAVAPIVAVGAVLVALGAVVVALWNNSQIFRDNIISLWKTVSGAIGDAVNEIEQFLQDNSDKVKDFQAVFKVVGDYIGGVIVPILKITLVVAIKLLVEAIKICLTEMWLWVKAFEWIYNHTIPLLNAAIWPLITAINGLIQAWDILATHFGGAHIDQIKFQFQDIGDAAHTTSSKIDETTQSLLRMSRAADAVDNSGILGVKRGIAFTGTAAALADLAKNADRVPPPLNHMGDAATATGSKLKTLAAQTVDLGNTLQISWGKITGLTANALAQINQHISDMNTQAKAEMTDMLNFANGYFNKMVGYLDLGKAFSQANDAKQAAADAQKTLNDAIAAQNTAVSKAQDAYGDSVAKAQAAYSQTVQAATDKATNAQESYADKSASIQDQIAQKQADTAMQVQKLQDELAAKHFASQLQYNMAAQVMQDQITQKQADSAAAIAALQSQLTDSGTADSAATAQADLAQVKIDAAQTLADAKAQADETLQGVISSQAQTVGNAQSAYDQAASQAAVSWVDRFKQQLSDMANWSDMAAKLAASKVPQAFIDSLGAMGPAAGAAAAQQLLDSGLAPTLVSQYDSTLNSIADPINKMYANQGTDQGTYMGTAAGKSAVASLKDEITKQAEAVQAWIKSKLNTHVTVTVDYVAGTTVSAPHGAVSNATGGYIAQNVVSSLHAGEFVLSRQMLSGQQPIPTDIVKSVTNQTSNNNQVTVNAFTNADPYTIGKEVAWAIKVGM